MSWTVVVGTVVALAVVSAGAVGLPKVFHQGKPVSVANPTPSSRPASPEPSPSPPSPSTPSSVPTSTLLEHPCAAGSLTATAKADQTAVAPRATVKLTSVLINRSSTACALGPSAVEIHVGSDPVPTTVIRAPAVLAPGATVSWSSGWSVTRCTAAQCRPAPPGPYTILLVWNGGLASASVVLQVLNVSPAPQPSYPPPAQ